MKKVMFLMLAVLCIALPCLATDHTGSDLLSMISLTPATATTGKVASLLGAPHRVEENKKRTLWYYSHGNTDVVISWSRKSESLLKFSFKTSTDVKNSFDNSLPYQLKSGSTDILQALKLLGTPIDVTVKAKTQEMHYAYEKKVLRLFFRDRVLVDYCLY